MPTSERPQQRAGRTSAKRCAVTLLEVLVVLGIVGILMALVFPAVQSSRESARRLQCQENLRQISVATHAFHSANWSLPSLYNGASLKYPLREWDLFHMHSWRVPLLPHLGQAALRERVSWDELATEPANASIAQAVVPAYVCPTGLEPATNMGWGLRHAAITNPQNPVPEADKYRVVRSDYDAIAGITVLPETWPPEPRQQDANPNAIEHVRWGIWGWPRFDNDAISGGRLLQYRSGRFRDITDGLSNTLAVVERGGKPTALKLGEPHRTEDDPAATYPGQVGWSASNTFAWAVHGSRVGVNESNSKGIYSLHPGGANVAIADGSVRFLSESTEFDTLVKMFSRSGGPED